MPVSVGIDLGTTYCAVAIIDTQSGLPKIVPNTEGDNTTPSVLQYVNGGFIFGSDAESAFIAGEPCCVATFKRDMGKESEYCSIEGRGYTSEDLSALLLAHLKREAEQVIGDTIAEAVITVPAYFYSKEREATMRAAVAAGLNVKKIINEPTAAALAYGLSHWRENAKILVYDLGGGTFDVTLIAMRKKGELDTIATRGDHYLGGRDWDTRIEDMILERLADELGDSSLRDDSDVRIVVRGLCEGIKKKLSRTQSVKVTVSLAEYGNQTVEISRAEFEAASVDLIDRTGTLCQYVVDSAGLSWRDITDVLLVGGSTRMPQVSQYIKSRLGKDPISHVNPDEAVALGAAILTTKRDAEYQALAVVSKDGSIKAAALGAVTKMGSVRAETHMGGIDSLQVREIVTHAMGIIAVNTENTKYINEIIIPANHPIPVRAAKRFRFYTTANLKNELDIFVLQGDSENPLECSIPYKYVVTGIRHVNKGEKIGTIIRVQYSYDENGIIHIQARQEKDSVDLPIRIDSVPPDMSKYGKPVISEHDNPGYSFGQLLASNANQSVVHKYKAVTFSNAEWEKYDNIPVHPSGATFNEPSVHVVANEEKIEFHGYNVSAMDEGVTYTISAADDFEIECDINTSTIQPHPGGCVNISLGIIAASLTQDGGNIFLGGDSVATVGSKFKLKMSLTNGGLYEVYTNGTLAGSKDIPSAGGIDVRFGLTHGGHSCQIISHAYISDIKMKQRSNQDIGDENSEVDTWEN